MNSSLTPIAARDFGPAQARHLLLRAGFGGTPAMIADAVRQGPGPAVSALLSGFPTPPPAPVDPDVLVPPTPEQRQQRIAARRAGDQDTLDALRREQLRARKTDRQMLVELQDWWLNWMLATPSPLQEKLVLLWHGHFASSHRQVRDTYLMYRQNQLFRDHAAGSFAELALGITRDPAMIRYLNNDRNVRRKPNENLARELMELFTLGEGAYSEQDIKEGARALTGYHLHDNDFRFRQAVHDNGAKTIFGQEGDFDGDDFVDLLLAHRQCARFVALKLYRHFVADVPEYLRQVPEANLHVIDGLADRLRRDRYNLAPTIEILLRSRHFYDPAIIGRKVKSPAELLVGTVRQLGTPTRDPHALRQAMAAMGQHLFVPPSVAGWPVGPPWVNTSTLFIRQNTCTYLLTGKRPGRKWKAGQIAYDPEPLLAGLDDRTPASVTNHLIDLLLGPHTPEARRQPLIRFMQQRSKGINRDALVALLTLITAMPEYQLC